MKKIYMPYIFIFWWAIMFPILNFSEKELIDIKNNTLEYTTLIAEILH